MATYSDRVQKSVTLYEPGPLPEEVDDLGLYLVTGLKESTQNHSALEPVTLDMLMEQTGTQAVVKEYTYLTGHHGRNSNI